MLKKKEKWIRFTKIFDIHIFAMSIVSNNIKYLRRLNGLTQEQFSRRIGIKRSLLGAYEEARANPNYDNLLMIAKVFGVSVDQLLKQDLRRIRDTPDLLQQSVLPAEPATKAPPVASVPPPPEDPKILSSIIDKYYRESPKIQLVSQKVMLKRVQWRSEPLPRPQRTLPPVLPTPATTPSFSVVTYVPTSRQSEYILKCQQPDYHKTLETFAVPKLPDGTYRAFEIGNDFITPGSLLIGVFVRNWYELADGTQHLVVLRKGSIVFRNVYNQLTSKGILILGSDMPHVPTQEVSLQEIVEIWEVKAYLSYHLPQPTVPLPRIKHLVNELKAELDKIKTGA